MDAARTDIEAGFAHLARGEWAGAVRSLSAAARREPGRLAVVRGLATALLCAGDVEGARRVLGEFTLGFPLSAEGWRLAGQLEWKVGKRDEAIRVIARGLERLPGAGALHRQMAIFLGAMGDVAGAARHAAREADERVERYLGAARGEVTEGVFDRGEPRFGEPGTDWLDRVAQDPKLLEGVLRVTDGRGDLAVLRELAARVAGLIEQQPRHADRWVALARLQLHVGDAAGALTSVDRALAVNPYYAEARRVRAEVMDALKATGGATCRRAA